MHAPPCRPAPALAVALALLASACGTTADHRSQGGSSSSSGGRSSSGASSSGSSSGGASSSSGGSSSGGASSSSGGSSSGGSSSSGGNACAGSSTKAQRQALDIYLMLDRSGSMGDPTGGGSTKWKAVTAALSSFVGQALDETSVGLQYFGLPAASCSTTTKCSTDADCGYCGGTCSWLFQRCVAADAGASSCNAADYAKPEVEIGPIAQTGPLIRTSMNSQDPSTDTPTSAALQGAIDHARAWASDVAHAGHAVLVVFATDGAPTWCDGNLDHINAIAESGLSVSPNVRTFVIGVGDLQSNLDGIAKAGGTGAAYIVDTGANVTDQFLKALNDIRGKTVGCSYAIPAPPAGQQLDYGLVNVIYRPGSGGAAITFGKVATAAACGTSAHAWHYDDDAAPKSIVLCPATCTALEADGAASVEIALGCKTTGEW